MHRHDLASDVPLCCRWDAPPPLAAQLIDDALIDGAALAVIAGTASSPADSLISSATFNLGPGRASRMQFVTVGGSEEDGEGSDAAGGSGGGGGGSTDFEVRRSSACVGA